MSSKKWICKNWQESIMWQQKDICTKETPLTDLLFVCNRVRIPFTVPALVTSILLSSHPRYLHLVVWRACYFLRCGSIPVSSWKFIFARHHSVIVIKLSEVNHNRKKKSAKPPRHKAWQLYKSHHDQVLRCSALSRKERPGMCLGE
jgi:hypothetical protein